MSPHRRTHLLAAAVCLLLLAPLAGCASRVSAPETPEPAPPAPPPGQPFTGEFVPVIVASGPALVAAVTIGIVRSTDQGASWSRVHPPMVVELADAGDALFGGNLEGVLRSVDHGLTWETVTTGLPAGQGWRRVAVAGGSVLAVVSGTPGLFRSTDLGDHWVPANDGLPAAQFLAIGGDAIRALASTYDGRVFRSLDGGATWTPADDGLFGKTMSHLAAGPGRLYASTWASEIFVSTDDGASWSPSAELPPHTSMRSLVTRGSEVFACTSRGLFRSADGGGSWSRLPLGESEAQVLDVAFLDGGFFAGTAEIGVQRSADGGATWTRAQPTGGGPWPSATVDQP